MSTAAVAIAGCLTGCLAFSLTCTRVRIAHDRRARAGRVTPVIAGLERIRAYIADEEPAGRRDEVHP